MNDPLLPPEMTSIAVAGAPAIGSVEDSTGHRHS